MGRMQNPQALARHVRVDLRGGYVGMPQQHLYGPQIGAVVQQVRRKSVPQGVRRNRYLHARCQRVPLDDLPKHLPRHGCATRRHKQCIGRLATQNLRTRLGEIAQQPGVSFFAKRHQAFFGSFARDPQRALTQTCVHGFQVHQLTHAKPAGVHQLQHRAVAQAQRRLHIRGSQQGFHLRFAHGFRDSLNLLRHP